MGTVAQRKRVNRVSIRITPLGQRGLSEECQRRGTSLAAR